MLLHHLDNLDSKMETVRGAVEKDKLAEGSLDDVYTVARAAAAEEG